MMTQYKTVQSAYAKQQGFAVVTDGYDLEKEAQLLEKALAQLNGILYLLVSDDNNDTVTIWRKKTEVDTIKTKD